MTLQKASQNPEKAPWRVRVWGGGELALAKETGGLALRTTMSLPLCVTSGSFLLSLGLSFPFMGQAVELRSLYSLYL